MGTTHPPQESFTGTPFPVFVVAPSGTLEPGLASGAAQGGAVGVVDLLGAPTSRRREALDRLEAVATGGICVRVAQDAAHLQDVAVAVRAGRIGSVLLVPEGPVEPDAVARLRASGARVFVEGSSVEDARAAERSGAHAVVAAHPDVAPRLAKEVTLPVVAALRGGPARAAVLRGQGVSGFLLHEEAWLLDGLVLAPDDGIRLEQSGLQHVAQSLAEAHPSVAKLVRAVADAARTPSWPPRAQDADPDPVRKEEKKMQSLPHEGNDVSRPRGPGSPRGVRSGEATRDDHDDLGRAIAVVGMGCVLPGANNVQDFWQVVENGVDCIREVSKDRWDPELFYDPKGSGDKSYTKIGGFLTGFSFNPIEFRIPPKAAEALDPLQRMTLVAVREAFVDAGLLDERLREKRPFDRDRVAVVLGNSMGGEVQRKYTQRIAWYKMEERLRASPTFASLPQEQQERLLEEYHERWLSDLPPITEDSMPGELSNVVSGRVANVFDLRGKNHTTDAACASSFAAFDMAIKSLLSGESDIVVTGGADRSMDIDTYVKFCKIGALSANGSTPFDARADGFVMGEGCAVFLFKRLADALRDGDKIHAVVRGVGSSSDGRGKGITAPNKRGQVLAVERGIRDAGVPPGSIQYMEAHGTSTRVGDVVEMEALSEALAPAQPAPGSVAIGSVKSQLGHLKSAAGAASLLKTVLALQHQVLPPSINFVTPNPNIDWARVPFRVVTKAEPWPEGDQGVPRRAGISSFGFGGTNFHLVLEEYMHDHHQKAVKAAQAAHASAPDGSKGAASVHPATNAGRQGVPPAAGSGGFTPLVRKRLRARAPLEAETLVLGAADRAGLVKKLEETKSSFPDSPFLETGEPPRFKDQVYTSNINGVKAESRVAMVVRSGEDARKQAAFALSCLDDEKRMRMAPVKGVFFGNGTPRGKVAFLFPGQGSQYPEMLLDLYQKYAIVRDTFQEADDILEPFLGTRLTSLVFPEHDRDDEEARKQALARADEALRRTEICQPAVLTVDIALWRLLRSVGIEPDAVAGHSLGEYAALVAAGILRFEDALIAVSARGKEMANVDVPDHGKMASVTADPETIQGVLDQIDDYVIMANKNCPSMTVIAGSTSGVDKAVQAFQERGVQATYIPVSAAFHSSIVAPASEPLSRLLKRLSVRRPHTPIYANVTGARYEDHDDPRAFHDYTVRLLSEQIASAVEWTKTIENMHQEGVRYFLEVGPKRALTAFVQDILKGQDVVAVATNHPKKGGAHHFNETYGVMSAAGFIPKVKHPQATAHYTMDHLDPLAALKAPSPKAEAPKGPIAAPVERSDQGARGRPEDPVASAVSTPQLRDLARQEGFVSYARLQAPVVTAMLQAGWETARQSGLLPGHGTNHPPRDEAPGRPSGQDPLPPGFTYHTDDIVVSGVSLGLPGRDRPLFDDGNAQSILAGENRIDALTPEERSWMTDKNIVRLKKGGDGSAEFERIDEDSKVIKLAGVPGRFDVVEEFGVDAKFHEALDITSELAIGATIDALRDAGIPLVRDYQRTSTGSHLPGDWVLPQALQDDTGIIFASAWPGYNNFTEELSRFLTQKSKGQARETVARMLERLADVVPDTSLRSRLVEWIRQETADLTTTEGEAVYEFNRRFVFRILAMGHAQVAQMIKAKGPNTQVNAACSSTTLAVTIAEDWIRTGRARRVIVVGADAPTASPLFEWLSAGFLAAGAATTQGDVENAALPFDRRRHGMINGCGAVGLVVERRSDVGERGMDGLVRLLATHVANSAYHASRLDVDHVAEQMERVVALAERRYGVERASLAKDLVFMSHETYTPARGGSASAEIKSLRRAFNEHADEVLVTNTKGFTGHPHGASIEDAVAVKMLQLGRVPPIPNLKERDPELGDLNLSTGGETDRRYTLRLAAGFGSQIALWVGECLTRGTMRVLDEAAHKAWLRAMSGQDDPRLEVVQRRLRVVDQGPPPRAAPRQAASMQPVEARGDMPVPERAPTPAPTPALAPGPVAAPVPANTAARSTPPAAPATPPAAPAAPPADAPDREAIVKQVVDMIVEQTGYPADMLEPDLDLEADLGIDTVKQAELLGLLREQYNLPQEEGIQIKDYPTLNHIADYITSRVGTKAPAATQPAQTPPGQAHPQASALKTQEPEAAPASPVAAPAEPAFSTQEKSPPQGPSPGPGGPAAAGMDRDDALKQLVALVAEQTGYPDDMLEPELDLEADLGIDTVKQAELFGIVREKYGLPKEEGIQIKDYPTLNHIADYIVSRQGAHDPATPADGAPEAAPKQADAPATATTTPAPSQEPASPTVSKQAEPATQRPSGTDVGPSGLGGLDDLDDGAPSFAAPRAPVTPTAGAEPSEPERPAPAQGEPLGDGAPEVPAPAGPTVPASRPAPEPPALPRQPTSAVASGQPGAADQQAPSLDLGDDAPLADADAGPPVSAEAPPGDPAAMKEATDHEAVVRRVTGLVAEQTGYPEDMLEPELDLEADLGIDTVKQAELFGVVRELYGLPLPEGLKIADYPTISRVADFVVEASRGGTKRGAATPGGSVEAPGGATQVPPATPAPAPEAEQVQSAQEAKQAQPAPQQHATDGANAGSARNDAAAGAHKQARTTQSVGRFVVAPVDTPLRSFAPREQTIEGVVLITQDRLGWAERFAERLSQEGATVALLGHTQPHDDVPGWFLPTDLSDPQSIERTVDALRRQVGPVGGIIHLAGLVDEQAAGDPVEFRARTRQAVRSLYLLARKAAPDLAARRGAPVVSVTRMGGTFALPGADEDGPLPAMTDPVHGGVAGLTKALSKELPSCFVRVLDLGAEVGPQDAARLTIQELGHKTKRTEVGYPELGRRVELEVRPRETTRAQPHPVFPDDHYVVSGGAQGVTAECLVALLESAGRDNAPALTLLGRTTLPPDIEQLVNMSQVELDARKKSLLERLRGENERVTPVMLEREWSKTHKAIEVHRNQERLRALGARVEYVPVDVQDHEDVARAVASARESNGPITGILHGAGLEVSKQLADKDPAQFDRVFDTKALGLVNLLWATGEDRVRQVCVFSSVAGRFGNLGQVDYSAANELAVRLAIDAGRRPGLRGFAIDWSAWGDVGMATRGGIMQVMEAAGVTPIPVREGVRFFVREWVTGDLHPEVMIAGSVGEIDQDHQVKNEPLPPVLPRVDVADVESMPLLDAFTSHVPHRYAVATRSLRLDRDLYLEDHRVDSVAYLPGVFGVEMFAEAAESLLSGREKEEGFTFIGAEDVEYRLPVKLLRDRSMDVRVVVERLTPVAPPPVSEEPVADGSDAEFLSSSSAPEPVRTLPPVRVRCRLESDFVNEAGVVLGDARVHFTGDVVLGVAKPHPVQADLPARPGDAQVLFDRGGVYDHFFHGPTFQVLDAVARIEGPNVAAIARFEQDGLFADVPRPRFRTAPLLREAMFQASGFWALSERSTMSLPAGIRSIAHHTQPADAPPGTSLVVVARHERDLDDMQSEYTVEAYTPEGSLVDRMEGYRMIRTGTHRIAPGDDDGGPREMPPRPMDSQPPAQPEKNAFEVASDDGDWELQVRDPQGKSAVSLHPLRGDDAVHVSVDRLKRVLDDPGFSSQWFLPEERRRIRGLRVGKRRVEHAAGVLAAKHAVARSLAKAGVAVDPRLVLVRPDPGTRAPTWSVDARGGLPAIDLSVSHSGPHALALARLHDAQDLGVGVDVESVQERDAALQGVAFTPQEIEWLREGDGDLARRTTVLWTLKEAVAKGLGAGLSLDLRDLRVVEVRADGTAVMELAGEAGRRASFLTGGGGAVRVEASTHRFSPGYVAAVARLVRGAS